MKRRTVVTLLGVLIFFLIFTNANAASVGYGSAGDLSSSYFFEFPSLSDMKNGTNVIINQVNSPTHFFDGIASDGDIWVGYGPGFGWDYQVYEYASLADMINDTWTSATPHAWGFEAIALDVDATDAVPEPATMLLLCSGLIGLAGARRKFNK